VPGADGGGSVPGADGGGSALGVGGGGSALGVGGGGSVPGADGGGSAGSVGVRPAMVPARRSGSGSVPGLPVGSPTLHVSYLATQMSVDHARLRTCVLLMASGSPASPGRSMTSRPKGSAGCRRTLGPSEWRGSGLSSRGSTPSSRGVVPVIPLSRHDRQGQCRVLRCRRCDRRARLVPSRVSSSPAGSPASPPIARATSLRRRGSRRYNTSPGQSVLL
jgi:hypothetical protein